MEYLETIKEEKNFKNRTLKKASEMIYKIAEQNRKNSFLVAKIIAEVDEKGAYKDDGFKTVHEWTAECFGIKKSVSYSMLKIGREKTLEVLDETGNVTDYVSSYQDKNGNTFSITQMERMSSLSEDEAEQLLTNGDITADMTCSDIMRTVKMVRDATAEKTPDEQNEQNEPKEITYTLYAVRKGSREREILLENVSRETIESIVNKYGFGIEE